MAHHNDHIVRATAANGMIRALAITAQQTVQEARERHGASPLATAALGRLLMATHMMGSLLKVDGESISLMVQCLGPLEGLAATAQAQGGVKGYATNPIIEGDPKDVPSAIGQGTLTVVRNSPFIEPYVSQIALVNGTISDDLTAYYILSEQIPTIVALDVAFDDEDNVSHAGGYFIQLMPGYTEQLLLDLESCVATAPTLSSMLAGEQSPEQMLQAILGSLDLKIYEETAVAFQCDCSRQRSEKTLLSLGSAELRSMAIEGEPIEIKCDFCNERYSFTPDQLIQLAETL